jgi:hypothetical protein
MEQRVPSIRRYNLLAGRRSSEDSFAGVRRKSRDIIVKESL